MNITYSITSKYNDKYYEFKYYQDIKQCMFFIITFVACQFKLDNYYNFNF